MRGIGSLLDDVFVLVSLSCCVVVLSMVWWVKDLSFSFMIYFLVGLVGSEYYV